VKALFYIPSLKSPEVFEEDKEPLSGDVFPATYPFSDSSPASFTWKKYYRSQLTFFYLPKAHSYVNMEILVNIFNGKLINTSSENINQLDEFKVNNYHLKILVEKQLQEQK
jgi:hypothetical protein